MKKQIAIGLIATLIATAVCAQEPISPQLNSAEIFFSDGSLVRMTLMQENVDVQTKYGKLSIPFNEIRRIELGLHVPPETDQQTTKLIKQLASDIYKERDGASKDLVRVSYFALSPLRKAAKSGDQEVAARATEVIKQISQQVAQDLLKLRDEDVIHTIEFIVIGKIASQAIKAHSPHFGEVSLKLSDLRVVQMRQRDGKFDLVVDATKHGSALDQWYDTGIMIDTGQRILITSSGQVDLWPQSPGQYMALPKGYNTAGKGGKFMAGALIGKIGEQGKEFLIGERHDGTTNEAGRLHLQITPSPWNNASLGNYRVDIATLQGSR